MIKLSIIIVNYNVKHFLEQALNSIFQSNTSFEYEVLVVDNYSADGSVEMLIANLPQVKVFAEKQNHGFSKGNNIAIKKSKGEFVLLLNPDTVLEEDTLEKVVEFMDKHKDVGGLGVKMMDGSGKFLPESKRGFPTPMAAFYKMSGLASLFPGSKKFGQYHLTYLDKNQTQEVDVLSGAFMLLRKSVLDNIGLLDETFFMYGEDIDLSYRIKKEGFKNFYFADTKIIHFKGESTKKGSLNYVRVFYQAMIIFLEKHYSGPQQKAIVLGIKIAIYFVLQSPLFKIL
jgi:GT2 family glycosyltransferase